MITIVATPRFTGPSLMRRKPLDQVRRRAREFSAHAQNRARNLTGHARSGVQGGIDQGRSAAALKLEALAEALRPHEPRKLHIGRPGLALAATLGLGVALGLAVSHQVKKRRAARGPQALLREELPPLHEAQAHEPVGAVP
ncbi:hypothetical protein LJR219_000399 [Phenylobacterium sp. LjRoot219]|uniref:hypothetical protein n=1 Tax=Phenylobacterium sp. LjRoot219 TaxID=3342283 RepID=UPI003ECC471D